MHSSEMLIHRLKAENQKWEQEISRQKHRVERLLIFNSSASPEKPPTPVVWTETAPESLLVRQLKAQIKGLHDSLSAREVEMDSLRKSLKAHRLMEALAENEEFHREIGRLQNAVVVLKHEITDLKAAPPPLPPRERVVVAPTVTIGKEEAASIAKVPARPFSAKASRSPKSRPERYDKSHTPISPNLAVRFIQCVLRGIII